MRTVAQLVELLSRHGRLPEGTTPEAQVSRLLRCGLVPNVPDEAAPDHQIFTIELRPLGIQVSARYDWDQARFVVRDWWTYNA